MKTTRKIISIVLCLMLVLSCIPMSMLSVSAVAGEDLEVDLGTDTEYWVTLKDKNGDGYYEIGTADELFAFATLVNEYNSDYSSINAILTNSITISDGRKWTPIGKWPNTNDYRGTFDGNNNIISGLSCDYSSAANPAGLFGVVGSLGVVKNLYISSSNIQANVGGIVVGYNAGTVDNCFVDFSNSISSSSISAVGGIVGQNYYGTITNCWNYASVSGSGNVGGIVGAVNRGKITKCISRCQINGGENVGGIAGILSEGTISDCNNIGMVTNGTYIGGIVGCVERSTVTNCLSTGTISGNGNKGGVVGFDKVAGYASTVINCYYLSTSCSGGFNGSEIKGSAEGKNYDQLSSGEVAYLLGEAWGQRLGAHEFPVVNGPKVYYGYISNDCRNPGEKTYSNSFLNEEIPHNYVNGICLVCGEYEPAVDSDNDTYVEIKNAGNLYWFAEQVNKGNTELNAILTDNITVNSGIMDENTTNAREWTPIGNDKNKYNGIFDGNGKTVSGLYYNNENEFTVGWFGITGGNSIIRNATVSNTYFHAGGAIGYIVSENGGIVENCINTSNRQKSNETQFIGGIVCDNKKTGIIRNCYNLGNINGSNYIGGIVSVNGGTVKNCYNLGNIYRASNSGAIAALSASTIENCYYLNTSCNSGIGGEDIEGQAEAKTSEQFASGEVSYLLGDAFGQKIGTDQYPVLGGDKVYCIVKDAYTKEKIYSNTPLECDVDLDGLFTIKDATMISKYLVGREELNDVQLSLADANNDGTININDVTQIQKILVRE